MDNIQEINAPYKYTFPIEKAFVGEDGKPRLVGAATGPEVDLEDQRVSKSLIDKWIAQINDGQIEVIYDDNHKTDSVVSELGIVEKSWKNDAGHMMVQILLDEDNPLSQYIHKAARKGKQYGMSIFGKASKFVDEVVDGRRVRTITDGTLTKIAHTTRPVWTPSFGTVLSKAIDAAKSDSGTGDNTVADATVTPQATESTEVETTKVTTESATTDSGAATNPETGSASAASTEDAAPVEKSITADTKRDAQKMAKFAKLLGELNVLGAEIGLSGTDDTTDTSADVAPVEKSQAVQDDSDEKYTRLEKSFNDQSALLQQVLDRVTDGSAPGVLRKSEPVDPLAELTSIEDPRERMRLAFAAAQGK